MYKFILIITFSLLIVNLYGHNQQLFLDNKDQSYKVLPKLYYFEDTDSKLSYEDISDTGFTDRFAALQSRSQSLGITPSTIWFRFELTNMTSESDWYLHVDYPVLNHVVLYIESDSGVLDTVIYAGMDLSSRQNKHLIIEQVYFEPEKHYTIYAQVKTNSFLIFPIEVMQFETFINQYEERRTLFLICYGIVVAMVLMNLILMFLTREKTYLWLSLFLFTLIVNSYNQYGIGIQFFPSLEQYFNNSSRTTIFFISIMTFTYFTIFYIDLNRYKKLLFVVKATLSVFIVFFLLNVFHIVPTRFFNKWIPLSYILGALLCLYSGIYTTLKGNRTSIYYLISFSIFVVASIVWFLLLHGIIRYHFAIYHFHVYAVSFFSITLTLGLMEKITAIEKEKARSAKLEALNEALQDEIEERTQLQIALSENEKKFRLLFHFSPQPISVSEFGSGRLIDVNEKFCELIALPQEKIIGKTTIELNILSESDRKHIIEEIKSVGSIQSMELAFKRSDGSDAYVLFNAKSTTINQQKVIITILSDISDIRKSQQEIKKLSTAVEQSASSIVITDLEGNIIYGNPQLFNLTGYKPEELYGQNIRLLSSGHHSDEFYRNLWDTILQGGTWKGEFYNRKKDGSLFWENATISAIFDERGRIVNFMAIKEDVTEKKAQQLALEESERKLRKLNATKDTFFSIIGHDLMNPFNALMGFNELTIESINLKDYEQASTYASIVNESSKRVFSLLQNLLIWSKSQSKKIEVQTSAFKISELVDNTLATLHNNAVKKNIEIEVQLSNDEIICADTNILSTVLRNLISNSIKFSDPGGAITISIRRLNHDLLFQVSDTGSGIPNELIDQLFVLDKTTSTKGTGGEVGTGLGLIICKEFIEAHKGTIWVENLNQGGCRFSFTIPVTW